MGALWWKGNANSEAMDSTAECFKHSRSTSPELYTNSFERMQRESSIRL